MPASEQTCRNTKLLHKVFAASGVLMLVGTIWMLVADHNRPWKFYQSKVRDIELTKNQWQQRTAKAELEAKQGRLNAALLTAQSQAIPADQMQAFRKLVQEDRSDRKLPEYAFGSIDAMFDRYNELAKEASEKRKAANDLKAQAAQAEKQATAAQLTARDLQAKLNAATGADKKVAENNYNNAKSSAEKLVKEHQQLQDKAAAASREATTAERAAADQRETFVASLQSIIRDARFREDNLLAKRKFRAANYDATRAQLDIAVRDELPIQEQERIQTAIDKIVNEPDIGLSDLTEQYQDASTHRKDLEKILGGMNTDVDRAQKDITNAEAEQTQLEKAYVERRATWFVGTYFPFPGKKWLELPILDAFNSPLKIDNNWHKGNTIDYNFSDVRRFDRCTTCHQSIEKTVAGSAVDPAYVPERSFTLVLRTPTLEKLKELIGNRPPKLSNVYGFELADAGLVKYDAVTVRFVQPASDESKLATFAAQSRVAEGPHPLLTGLELRESMFEAGESLAETPERPGLMSGDVIERINGNDIFSTGDVVKFLIDSVKWGEPVRITVRRGVPHPYASHPRLDLYIGSTSPHTRAIFACTICHEGQGSATAFKWASHTPNTPKQANEWALEHGWFDNHHWIYPMFPKRFAESNCLKCHHNVTELEGALITADGSDATGRLVDPPAPKLMHGYNLIRKYGCYGCHEIQGFAGADKRVGPDLRLEPNVSEAVQQLMTDPGFAKLTEQQQQWAVELKFHPELDGVRHQLLEVINEEKAAKKRGDQTLLTDQSHKLGDLLKDVEAPGAQRKVGPSLRRVAHKLSAEYMYDWVQKPKHFRPTTRMPQFFGLWEHLKIAEEVDEEHAQKSGIEIPAAEKDDSLEISQRYEPLEILGVVTYLRDRTQPYEYAAHAEGTSSRTLEERIANGKVLFENRGCLACHNHKAFPDVADYRTPDEIVQGPDLSAVAEKFAPDKNPNGPDWLYSWLHNPSSYNPRTLMPNLLLEPYDEEVKDPATGQVKKDANGQPVVLHIDPIADIIEFLLADSRSGWQPDIPSAVQRGTLELADKQARDTLDELVRINLEDAFYKEAAIEYSQQGIPENMRADMKGAEIELVGRPLTEKKKLLYVGRKTIARYGCYGCHDVPEFEDAKPIGTGLADWGRKDPSRLAFEHITHYVEEKQRLARMGKLPGEHGATAEHRGAAAGEAAGASDESPDTEYAQEIEADAEAEGHLGAADHAFYEEALMHGSRIGFIWQKLKEPRSYDYKKTKNKKYSERLRMPQFPLSDVDREAVVTFVLGLVADPPEELYIYKPSPRQEAILAGRRVAEKYNCVGCHMFELEKWDLAYDPGRFGKQLEVQTFPFVNAHFTPDQLQASAKVARTGERHATVAGLPTIDDAKALPIVNDFEGDPVSDTNEYDPASAEYLLDLWKPVALDGEPYQTAVLPLKLTADVIQQKNATRGGFLAKYLVPRVTARARQVTPTAKGTEAWGWVPPPLVGEGAKVQTDWLHDFLLDPHRIRPEVVLRMPKFNMSSEEASELVNYFAAKDNVPYPYDFSRRRQSDYLAEKEHEYDELLQKLGMEPSTRFDDARQIVFNKAGCIQCHQVGDYRSAPRGPDLAQVYKRLRGDYVRRWIANPKRILPYTSMPENFKYLPDMPDEAGFIVTEMVDGQTKKKKLVQGTATEQLDAMVDLLMNFDLDAQRRSPYAPLAPTAEASPAATATGGGNSE